jgi:exonuclease I
MMVAPISVSCSNPNEWALFDLQFDPEQLLTADDGTLRDAIDGKVKMIRRVSANAQPPLLSTEFTPANVRGGRLPMETYLERARKVRDNWDFQQRTSRLLAERYVDQRSAIYVEQRIYDGFPSRDDEARLATFHRQEWPHRVSLIPSIEDDRCRELGERIIFVEQPAVLTDAQRRSWQGWHRDRLLAAGETPWLTIAGALSELEELSTRRLSGNRRSPTSEYCLKVWGEGRVLTHSQGPILLDNRCWMKPRVRLPISPSPVSAHRRCLRVALLPLQKGVLGERRLGRWASRTAPNDVAA